MPTDVRAPADAVAPESATDRVYREVKDGILDGSYESGAMLSEGSVSTALGVSRTPVREAFLRLQAEGLMRLYPKRGALVTPVAPGEVDDVLDTRRLIETHAVERACARPAQIVEALLAELDELTARQQSCAEAGDEAGFAELDVAIHRAVVAAGGNPILTDFYGSLRDRQRRMTTHSVRDDPRRLVAVVAAHRRLAACIRNRDVPGYGAELARHLDAAHRHITNT